ncbi:hypothetical protein ERJ75_001844700 [Trypanosoma vivax]|nr:hypothetical protein ERJ75_001844700 [Trypanosoma vivax]
MQAATSLAIAAGSLESLIRTAGMIWKTSSSTTIDANCFNHAENVAGGKNSGTESPTKTIDDCFEHAKENKQFMHSTGEALATQLGNLAKLAKADETNLGANTAANDATHSCPMWTHHAQGTNFAGVLLGAAPSTDVAYMGAFVKLATSGNIALDATNALIHTTASGTNSALSQVHDLLQEAAGDAGLVAKEQLPEPNPADSTTPQPALKDTPATFGEKLNRIKTQLLAALKAQRELAQAKAESPQQDGQHGTEGTTGHGTTETQVEDTAPAQGM